MTDSDDFDYQPGSPPDEMGAGIGCAILAGLGLVLVVVVGVVIGLFVAVT